MIPVHKILRGEGAEKFLPFALSRARVMRARLGPERYGIEKYNVEGFTIDIAQMALQSYVRIVASGGGIYEFATGAFDEVAQGFVDTSGLRLDSARAPLPLFSMTFDPPVPPLTPQWRDVAPGYTFARDGTETQFFDDFLSFQPQGVNEAVWWKDNKMSSCVHSAWGMPLGRMNTAGLCDALHSDGGTKGQCTIYFGQTGFYKADIATDITTYLTTYAALDPRGYQWYTSDEVGTTAVPQYDRLFDIPPVYYQKGAAPLGGIGPYRDDYTWYRHGALVASNLGNKFFVVADSKGGFMFYRAKAYWADPVVVAACVDQPGFPGTKAPASTEVLYQRVVPSYPAWVTLPADGVATPLQWWNWQFNKDASKAVTVALNSTNRAKWFHHASVDDPTIPSNPAWWEDWFVDPAGFTGVPAWNVMTDEDLYFNVANKGTACRKDLPGLVEVSITVTETGPGDLDFTPSVVVTQSDYFGDTGTYWVDAGYAYPGLSVAEDALVTAEIECYRSTEHWFHLSSAGPVGAVDGSDYVPVSAWIHIPDFGSSWVVKSGGVELAREVLQSSAQIVSFLPTFTPNTFGAPTAPWVLNNAGRYWHGNSISRLSTAPSRVIAAAKGMFTCGSTAVRQVWLDETFPLSYPQTYYSAEIVAADLRSLSYVVRQEKRVWPGTTSGIYATNIAKTVQHKVVAFEEEQTVPAPAGTSRNIARMQTFTGWLDSSNEDVRAVRPPSGGDIVDLTYTAFTMPSKPASTYPMDKDLHEQLFTTVGLSRLPHYTHHEIRTTPKGDWSVWATDADTGYLDILAPKGRPRTTHLAQFNSAFDTSLAADYYGDTSATAGYRNTGGFGLSRNWLPR